MKENNLTQKSPEWNQKDQILKSDATSRHAVRKDNPELKESCITTQDDKQKPDLTNSYFASFEEVKARRQTAQSEYLRNQLIKTVFGSQAEEERRQRRIKEEF